LSAATLALFAFLALAALILRFMLVKPVQVLPYLNPMPTTNRGSSSSTATSTADRHTTP
jgi:hypothetical protein